MEKYKFILKPIFFIFSLLFATWLVFRIEKISPSDFGKYKYLFDDAPGMNRMKEGDKQYLKKIFSEYKRGLLDSIELDRKLDNYLRAGDKSLVK